MPRRYHSEGPRNGKRRYGPIPQFPIPFLEECFRPDFEAGTLTWVARPLRHFPAEGWMKCVNSRFAGTPAIASMQSDGYCAGSLTFEGVQYTVRRCRIIWAMYHGEWPPVNIGHRNDDRGDDRIENLRLQSKSQRAAFSRRTPGPSGIVSVRETGSGYVPMLRGRKLGKFRDLGEAVQVRNMAALEAFGEFARLVEVPA